MITNVTQNFTAPIGIATGPKDEIFVLDYSNPKVIVLKQNLSEASTITFKGEVKKPTGIAVGNDMIAVGDQNTNLVKLFSFQGNYHSKIGSFKKGMKPGQFNCPNGMGFNSKGILYVTDYYNYRVQAFDTNNENKYCGEFGSQGTCPGQFKGYPGYIAVDKNDLIYVTDYSNNSINIYDADGIHGFLCKIECYAPWAIAVTPDDCLVVVNYDHHKLFVFSPPHQIGHSRQLVTKYGSKGSDKGQFKQVYGVAVNTKGIIYIAEYGNKRIQVINT